MHNRNTYRNHPEDSLSTGLNKNNEGGTTVGSPRGAGGHTSCAAAPVLSSTRTRKHTNEKKRKRRGCFFALLSLVVLLFIVGRMTSTSITNSTTGSNFLSKEKQHKHDDGINTTLQLSQIAKKDLNKTTKPAAAICTKKALFRRIPSSVRRIQYRRVVSAQEILAYIIQKLDNVGAPVTLMFGTLLHEYRNGTGPCLQGNFHDKDLDIAVFAQHIPLVVALADDILKKFQWKLKVKNEKDKILVFTAKGQGAVGRGYQIDIYGLECNTPTKGLLYSPWQNARYAMNALLPFVKYKTIPYDNATHIPNSEQHLQFVHMPYNPKCFLQNLYGDDFMIPRKGTGNSDGVDPKYLYNRPKCGQLLSSAEQKELERQLAFCESV